MAKCERCFYEKVCKVPDLAGYVPDDGLCDAFLDRSKVVVLPCKVGDTVYFIKSAFTYFTEPKAETIQRIIMAEYDMIFKTQNRAFNTAVIGETVFLTREEAEQALREREEK